MPAAGVDGQYGPSSGGAPASSSSYTPKPVASLLGLGGAPSGHYGPTPGSTTFVEEKIGVPNGVVGFIIGRGGESILSMQRRSGCKVQIQKEFEMAPGSTQRVITLTADTKDSVDMARGIIEGMVKEKMMEQQQQKSAAGGSVGGPGLGAAGGAGVDPQTARMNQAIAEGHAVVKVQVRP
jgi:far upstream element-binding protein